MRFASASALVPPASLLAVLALGLGLAGSACGDDGGATSSSTSSSGGGDDQGQGGAGEGGATSTTGGAGAGTPLVVLNWNVRNLFDTDQDSTSDDEIVYNEGQYEAKIEAVAAVLRDIDPDVAVLQEVENDTVLQDLADRVGTGFVDVRLVEGNDFRGIDVGALSKVPFDSVVSHKDDSFSLPGGGPKTYTRDAPEFHVTHAGRKIVFIGVHFRSKGGDDDPERRLAEAVHTREIADGLAAADPEAGVVVLGDYNDLPGSDAVEVLRNGTNPPSSAVFLDAVDAVPEADRWTFDFQGTLELIDHQMANPVAAAWLDTASVSILHGAAVEAASDHSPVTATYLVR